MTLNYACLVLLFACTLPGRAAATVIAIGKVHGRRPGVLLVWLACTIATLAFSVWAGGAVGKHLAVVDRTVLACLAAMFAAMELLFVPMPRGLREPTHSLGALSLVLTVRQVTGAPFALLLGFAVASPMPMWTGIVGVTGALIAAVSIWIWGNRFTPGRILLARRTAALAVLIVAVVLALSGARIL